MSDLQRIDNGGLQKKPFDKLTPAEKKNLTLAEKKEYMLQKYGKKQFNINDIRKFGLFYKPYDADRFTWELIGRYDTVQQAEEALLWRYEFHQGDTGKAFANDPRLKTFHDETQNVDSRGRTIEPGSLAMYDRDNAKAGGLMNNLSKDSGGFKTLGYYSSMSLDYRGEYTIMPVYNVEDSNL